MVLLVDQSMYRQLVLGGDGERNVLISINARGNELQAEIQPPSWICPFLLHPDLMFHVWQMATIRFKPRQKKSTLLSKKEQISWGVIVLIGAHALP